MSKKLVLGCANENWIEQASSITLIAGTEKTGYTRTNLAAGSWAFPFKIDEVNLDIRFHFSQPVLPKFSVIGNSNLTVAAVLQGNATDTWGAPAVSQAFAVPTLREDLYYTSPFLNMSAYAAQAHWRLTVTGNGSAIIIGALWLGAGYNQYSGHVLENAEFGIGQQTITNTTETDVDHSYATAPGRRQVIGDLIVTASELEELIAYVQIANMATRSSFVALDDSVNDAIEARFAASGLTWTPLGGGYFRVSFPLREVSRGMRWP